MQYAVLFKIYFVDPFVLRQLERLKARVGSGHLYVVADETGGPVDPIPHDRIIRMNESAMVARGFANGDPERAMFWHSADYSLYPLFEEAPRYDHYLTVEYDAVINTDIDSLMQEIAAQRLDFVGRRIDMPVSQWGWSETCDTLYDAASLRPYLNCIAAYSAAAVEVLRERRLALSRSLAEGSLTQYPISEAFIATELARHGRRIGELGDFGDTSRYDWWPPTPEPEVEDCPTARSCTRY